ncbi:MAG: RNase adapter RapZ [Synechococcus sp.]
METPQPIVFIAGLSGAGKKSALSYLEGLSYFCMDSVLPHMSIAVLAELTMHYPRVAIALELTRMEFVAEFDRLLDELLDPKIPIVFLEAADDVLVQRLSADRARHPLQDRSHSLLDAIQLERQMLAPVRLRSTHTLNTGVNSAQQLRICLEKIVFKNQRPPLAVSLTSFGFKYGLPTDANLVFDVRFLPNPYYISTLRPLTGKDSPIQDFLFQQSITQTTYHQILNTLTHFLPLYAEERRPLVQLAIGCTGGQHRSVAFVERLATDLQHMLSTATYRIQVQHRHLERSQAEIALQASSPSQGDPSSAQS